MVLDLRFGPLAWGRCSVLVVPDVLAAEDRLQPLGK